MLSHDNKQYLDLDVWATQLVGTVVSRLKERISNFESDPAPGISAPTIAQQRRKFTFLSTLIAAHDAHDPELGRRKPQSELHRIIKGLIVHFITQSERDIQPVNIEHNRNPVAKKYWEEQQPDAFENAKLPGLFHVAASYNYLKDYKQGSTAAKFHVIGELVRVCIDVFKEEHPKLNLPCPTQASIYNDHREAIDLAFSMRRD